MGKDDSSDKSAVDEASKSPDAGAPSPEENAENAEKKSAASKDADPKRAAAERKRLRRYRLSVLACSTLLALFVADCGLRIVKGNRAFQPDPDLIRSLKPHSQGLIYSYETYENLNGLSTTVPDTPVLIGKSPTNSIGLRMAREVGPKGPGEKRILLLGDSYAEGAFEAPAGTRFSDLASAGLELDPQTHGWWIINGGIENGCPSQYALMLARMLPQLRPDIVIIALAPNDLSDDLGYEKQFGFEFDADGLPIGVKARTTLWLQQKSYLMRYVEVGTRGAPWLNQALFSDASPSTPHIPWQRMACAGDPESKKLFEEKTGKYLQLIRKQVEAAGAKLGIFMIQYSYFFENEKYYEPRFPTLRRDLTQYGCLDTHGKPYQAFMEEYLRRYELVFHNTYAAVEESEREHPTRKLFHFYDYHFSPAGHQLNGRELHAFAKSMIIPAP